MTYFRPDSQRRFVIGSRLNELTIQFFSCGLFVACFEYSVKQWKWGATPGSNLVFAPFRCALARLRKRGAGCLIISVTKRFVMGAMEVYGWQIWAISPHEGMGKFTKNRFYQTQYSFRTVS